MKITDAIAELEERLQSYISQIEISYVEYTPFIVEVGALTVGTEQPTVFGVALELCI